MAKMLGKSGEKWRFCVPSCVCHMPVGRANRRQARAHERAAWRREVGV